MPKIEQSLIKEIAREIAIGNTCYIHKKTTKLTTIDHSIEDVKAMAAQEQTQSELDEKIDNYIKIEELSKQSQLVIMEDFAEEFQDKSISKQISNALKWKNPVRNFNQLMESDIELNQQWINFYFDEYQRRVSNLILDAYRY